MGLGDGGGANGGVGARDRRGGRRRRTRARRQRPVSRRRRAAAAALPLREQAGTRSAKSGLSHGDGGGAAERPRPVGSVGGSRPASAGGRRSSALRRRAGPGLRPPGET